MKFYRLYILALAFLASLFFVACERKYDAPLLTEPEVVIGDEGIITIAKYKEMYSSLPKEGKLIEEDFAIRAVVVGNDISGNIYKQIYVADATGGISIGIDQNNISSDYPIGQEVVIKLQGLAATSYGGVTQVGMLKTNANRIPYEIAKVHILKHKWPDAKKASPTVTTIDKFSNTMVGTLIQLEDVYFVEGGKQPFAVNEQTVNRNLRDKAGNTVIVRNSGYATFANDILPKGNGTVVGILSKFNNDYQLFLRSADDCFGFSGKEPDTGSGNVTPPNPDQPSTGSVIYSEDFSSSLGKMTPKSITGSQTWTVNTQFKNANMTGFAGGKSNANEDWLISPVFDLSVATSLTISFKHTINKGDVSKMKEEQTLWVSTNYSGDVASAKWEMVTIPNYPTGTDWTYVGSGNISLSKYLGQKSVVFAFKYLCTDASSANWQIQDLKVTGNGGKLLDGGGSTPSPQPNPQPTPDPGTPTPATGNLLFPGSNFEDWVAFMGALNNYGLQSYATQADGGQSGKALQIKGKPAGNDYVFTALAQPNDPKSGKTITFYLKGTAGKSLSINVFKADGKTYAPFNLGTVGSSDITLSATDKNQYAGTINTNGKWVKVTLNIAGMELPTSGNLFALKVGKEVDYNLLVDEINIE